MCDALAGELALHGFPVDRSFFVLDPEMDDGETPCSQLTVCLVGVQPNTGVEGGPTNTGSQGHLAQLTGVRWFVTYRIRITRCTMHGEIFPTTDDQQADAVQLASDVWLITNYLQEQVRTGGLFDSCNEAFLDGATPVANEGGVAGYQFQLRLAFDHYKPDNIVLA